VFKPLDDKGKSEAALTAQLVHGVEPSLAYLLLQLADLSSARLADHVFGAHSYSARTLFTLLAKALLVHKQPHLLLRVLFDQGCDLAAISDPSEITPWHTNLAHEVIEVGACDMFTARLTRDSRCCRMNSP
jgi:hypothetical protein